MQVSPPVPRVTSQEIQTSGDLMKLVAMPHVSFKLEYVPPPPFVTSLDTLLAVSVCLCLCLSVFSGASCFAVLQVCVCAYLVVFVYACMCVKV